MSTLARLPTEEAGSAREQVSTSPATASFRYSVFRTAGLLVITLLMMAAAGAVALRLIPVKGGEFAQWVGAIGLIFFAVAALVVGSRLLKRGPILEISPQGLRDYRIAPGLIAWDQITALSVIKADRQRYVAFKLRPVHMAQLSIPLWRRAAAQFSGPRKWDGLTIAASGLDGSIDDIIQAINEALVAGGYAEP
jgi:hypothetical protein